MDKKYKNTDSSKTRSSGKPLMVSKSYNQVPDQFLTDTNRNQVSRRNTILNSVVNKGTNMSIQNDG